MARKRWAVLALAGATLFVLGGASSLVIAGVQQTSQANSLAVIKTVATEADRSTTSESFEDISGVARTATSTATTNVFIARYTGEGECFYGEGEVRIVVKDLSNAVIAVMLPGGEFYDFCSGSEEVPHSQIIERTITGLAPGTYKFQVQFRGIACCPGPFTIDSSLLVLERYTA